MKTNHACLTFAALAKMGSLDAILNGGNCEACL